MYCTQGYVHELKFYIFQKSETHKFLDLETAQLWKQRSALSLQKKRQQVTLS